MFVTSIRSSSLIRNIFHLSFESSDTHNISIDIAAYEPTLYNTKEYEEDSDNDDMI